LDIHKSNIQRCDLARKGQGIIIETRIIIVTRILVKIKSCVISLAAWRKILKQVNFCDASELMPPFRRNMFQHICNEILHLHIWLYDSKLSTQTYSRRMLL